MKAVYLIAGTIAALLIITLIITLARGLARAQLRNRQLSRQLRTADAAITAIEDQAALWSDLDSVLATAVRTTIGNYRSGAPLTPPPPTPPTTRKTLR